MIFPWHSHVFVTNASEMGCVEALRGENLELKQELTLKDQQIAGLSAELAALKLQVAAKAHEANVKARHVFSTMSYAS